MRMRSPPTGLELIALGSSAGPSCCKHGAIVSPEAVMSGESCPLPSPAPPNEALARMLVARRIAIVGLSDDPSRPSFGVASYLVAAGKEIIPINPNYKRVLGLTCYPALADAPKPIDVVNVFRRPEFCADVV